MSRTRARGGQVDVWPALSDTMLAFLLLLVLLFVFQVARNIAIVHDDSEPEPWQLDHRDVEQLVGSMRSQYPQIMAPELEGSNQRIVLGSDVLFQKGSADLNPEGRALLIDLVSEIQRANLRSLREVHVLGHTDSQPINTYRFPSNWELSAARATRIIRLLSSDALGDLRIDPSTLTLVASGFASFQPRSDTPADNRRIELRLVYYASDGTTN